MKRNVVIVYLDERTLDVLLRDGATVRVVNGIPRDAELLGVYADFARRSVAAMFAHPSFPLCEEGAEPERRWVGFEVLEHPMAELYDLIPLRIGMDEQEYVDMRRWICQRAAAIEGRAWDGDR